MSALGGDVPNSVAAGEAGGAVYDAMGSGCGHEFLKSNAYRHSRCMTQLNGAPRAMA